MNYLKQLKGFFLRRRLYPLSSSAIALYYLLFEQFALVGFPEVMEIPILRLISEAGIGKTAVYRARRELVEKGYLRLCEPQFGLGGNIYRLNIIDPDSYTHSDSDTVPSIYAQRENRMLHFGGEA